ncbi:MAG: sulfur carrier protein ThiS [Chloroflexi bacterium]|nr:sulfur carrier protein ThiS [Chloroflexota bacterium]
MIKLTVNGKPRELERPTPLLQFLQDHGIDSRFVAVAYNGTVLQKEEFAATTLDQGNVVEIVRPVGGG